MFEKKIPNPELRKFRARLESLFKVIPASYCQGNFTVQKEAFLSLVRRNGTKTIFVQEGNWETYFAFVFKGKIVQTWLKNEVKA